MGLLRKDVRDVESDSFDDFYEDSDFKSFDETYDDYSTSSGNAELSKVLIETEHFLNNIELALKNQRIEKKKLLMRDGTYRYERVPVQIEGTAPMMNNKGVNQVLSIVRTNIDHVMSLTSLTPEMYLRIIKKFIMDVNTNLIVNRQKYELLEHDIRLVKRTYITNPVIIYLTKALGDKERGYNYNKLLKDLGLSDEKSGVLENFIRNRNDKRRGVN